MRCSAVILSVVALAAGVIATPTEPSQYELVKRSCGGGTVSCCNNVQSSSTTTFNRVCLARG